MTSKQRFRWLTRLFPPSFRDQYEDEMLEVLEHDHASRGSRLERAAFWERSVRGALGTAGREHLADLLPELRHVLRSLRRRPLFLAVSIASLGVGIGATAVVFATVGSFYLQPIPGIEAPDRLINIKPWSTTQEAWESASYPDVRDLAGQLETVDRLAAFSGRSLSVRIGLDDLPQSSLVQVTTANFADTIGARPSRGRYFTADESANEARVAFVSHRFWQDRLGAPDALPEILVNGARFEVVGVGPPGFVGIFKGFPSDVFLPLGIHRFLGLPDREDRSVRWLELVGRLTDGATVETATAELEATGQRMARQHPATHRDITLHVEPTTGMDADYRSGLLVFLSVLGVLGLAILGIATFNVAGMMAGRNLERQGEAALRRVLGAPRFWLARRSLLESLVLAVGGGLLGASIAWFGAPRVGAAFQLLDERIDMPIAVDGTTVVGVFVLTLLAAFCAATLSTRSGRSASLASVGRGRVGGGSRGRRLLVVGQVVLSFTVLMAAFLFLGATRQAARQSLGFDPRPVVTTLIDPRLVQMTPAESATFYQRLLEATRQDSSVEAVALSTRIPLGLGARFFPNRATVAVPGHQPPEGTDGFSIEHARVSSDFFDVLDIPMEAGRSFRQRAMSSPDSSADEPLEVVVNRAFAERFFDDDDVVGREVSVDGQPAILVGLTPTTKTRTLDEAPRPMMYLSLEQMPAGRAVLLAKAVGPTSGATRALRDAQRDLAPDLPIQELRTLESIVATGHLPQRVAAATTGSLGLLGLLLSSVGLYGVVAQWLASRTAEIGLRASLGATPNDLVRLVLRQGLSMTFWGIALAVPVAVLLARSLQGFLYGLDPIRPLLILGLSFAFAAVTALACWGPARRVRRVSPQSALRES